MNSKDYSGLMEAYNSVYDRSGNNISQEVSEFCSDFMIFEEEADLQYFVEELFKDEELVLEFYYDVLSFSYGIDTILTEEVEYLDEVRGALISRGLKAAGGLLKKLKPGIQKAAATGMNQKTLAKKGIRPVGYSSKGKKLSGDVANDELARQATARAAKNAAPGPSSQKPEKYLDMLKDKKASSSLAVRQPSAIQKGWERHKAAGGPSADTIKKRAITDTALTTMLPAMMMAFPGAKTAAKAAAPIVRSATTAASAALPAVKTAAKKVSSKIGNPWNQFPKKATKQLGIPKTGPSSRLPGGSLPPSPAPKASLPPASSKSSAIVKSTKGGGVASGKIEPVSVRDVTSAPKLSGSSPKASLPGRSQQFMDVERMNKMSGGGLMGTRDIKAGERRAPKPAWGSGGSTGKTSGGAIVKTGSGGALAKTGSGGALSTKGGPLAKTGSSAATDARIDAVSIRDMTPRPKKPKALSPSKSDKPTSDNKSLSAGPEPTGGKPKGSGFGKAALAAGLGVAAGYAAGGMGKKKDSSVDGIGSSAKEKATGGRTGRSTGGARTTGGSTGGARTTGGSTGGARTTGGSTGGARTTGGSTGGARTTGGAKATSPMKPKGGTVSDVSGGEKLSYMQRQAKELRDMRKKSQERTISMGGKPATKLVRDDYNSIIFNYLIREGYADSEKTAFSIMNAMSEDWKNSILG